MARYSIDGQILTDIADAIRSKGIPATSAETYAPGLVYGVNDKGTILYDTSRPNAHWSNFDPMWGPSHWFTQVITVPEGVSYTEIKFSIELNYNREAFFIAEGEYTEMPEECLYYYQHQDSTNAMEYINNIELTTKAKTITFGCYVLETLASMKYYAKLTYIPTLTPEEMATNIDAMTVLVPSLLEWEGNIDHKDYYGKWDKFIESYGNQITTKDIGGMNSTFEQTQLTKIPFEINCVTTTGKVEMVNFCRGATSLKEAPVLNNLRPGSVQNIFARCQNMIIPEDYGADWDWSWHTAQSSGYNGYKNGMFDQCYSLRRLPLAMFTYGNPNINYSYHQFRDMNDLYALDKLTKLPCPHKTAINGTGYSGIFYNMFVRWNRCQWLTFADDIGTMKWAKQTIDLSQYFGWANSKSNILNYNSGITADKQVTDEASYIALVNDPDWFTTDVGYSRYNLTSAISTINSLPDCSEYTASYGANTIKFKGDAGNKTSTTWAGDTPINIGSGAINKLTDEHIAVAAAKGWTVAIV